MTSEFKKIKNNEDTHYVLETATSGATSAGAVATAPGKSRKDSILAQEKKETPKPRNFVAKNAKMGGAGKMKDKSKTIPRKEKHKKPVAEGQGSIVDKCASLAAKYFNSAGLQQQYDIGEYIKANVKQGVAEGWKEKLGAATVAGAMALGAGGASADTRRVTPDGQGGFTGGWKPTSTQQSTDTAPTQSPASTTQHLSLPIPAAQAQYDNATKLLTYKGKQYKWDLDAQSTGQGEVVSAPSLAVGSRSMGPTNVELNPNGTYNRAPVNEATHHLKRGVAEGFNGEYDDEVGMAHTNLLTSARAVMGLLKTIDDKDNLPEWVQEKIAKAEMMLVGVWDYLQSQKEQGIDPQQDANETYGRHDRRDAYQRDYDSSVSGMGDRQSYAYSQDGGGNDERHDLDPSDWYIVKDGKMYKTSVYPRQEQEAIARGYSRTKEEAKSKADSVAEGVDPYFESLKARVEELAKK